MGLDAFTPDEFDVDRRSFDSILISHVLEHLTEADGTELIRTYLPYLKAEGKLVMISPQEWAYRLDPTHVRFVGFDALRRHADATELRVLRQFSFPLPRAVGRFTPYNEFILIAVKDTAIRQRELV
jgi:predicted SAM-dependent methyltransferase